jgi:hypothetical protein
MHCRRWRAEAAPVHYRGRGPGTVPLVVVLVFLFVIAPSIFFVIVSSIAPEVTEQ